MRILRGAAALVLAATAASQAAGEVATRTLEIAGTRRSFILYLPEKAAGERPLVVALHGGGSTAEQMMTFSRFNTIAAREGFAVAYPQGTGRRWNDGRVFRGHGETDADDVTYIRAVVADIAKVAAIDRARVYAAGISNGGFMSLRLACEAADLFAAVAPVTATMPADLGERCRPTAPVAVLLINGTADPVVPYDGGQVRTLLGLRGAIWSTERTVSFWAEHNRCASPPDVRAMADRDIKDSSRVVEVVHVRCDRARVRLLRIEGGGHTWPGGTQYLPVAWIGPTNRDIDASEVIWRFFKSAAR